MESTENKHLFDAVVDALKRAATELEELQLQVNLGKAEASEKFEEWKKEFSGYMNNAKSKARKGADDVKNLQEELERLMDELRVQLELGKADGYDAFKAQKKKILEKIHEIENKVKNNPTLNKLYAVFLVQMEKFKIFLEWLEEKFKEGKSAAKDKFDAGKETLNSYIDDLKNKVKEFDSEKWNHFQEEVAEAFTNFKQSFAK